ncbi:MAG: hypothetical protein EOP06_14660 [Proteobacteria bacterium]|nr:MAG: hypothetical protein EOP06_14660 [Pseudomonadota bacterium]
MSVSGTAFGKTKTCAPDEAKKVEATASTLKTWQALFNAFKLHSHCDDGGISEGFSESVSNLLADRWDQFNELHSLVNSDAGFKRFVIKHIDRTITRENAKHIVENAKMKCPADAKAFCAELINAAR